MKQASAHSARKGGIGLFTKSTALEFAEDGVPIHPCFVDTPMTRNGLRDGGEREAQSPTVLLGELVAATRSGVLPHLKKSARRSRSWQATTRATWLVANW